MAGHLNIEDPGKLRKGLFYLAAVGIVSILLSSIGLVYNASALSVAFRGGFDSIPKEADTPYFTFVFFVMSAICIVCYALLIWSGIEFVRGKTRILRIFIGTLIFEVIYFFSIGISWGTPVYGTSIAAATGIANGGMVIQGLVLFPLWAPFLAIWAANRLGS